MVVGVRKGKIVGTHIGTVDSFEIKDKNSNLNHKQYQELYGIYDDIVKLVKAKD